MLLSRGSGGAIVKDLQRGLNRLGSLLIVDGSFGGSTATAIVDARRTLSMPGGPDADDVLQEALGKVPDPSSDLTAPGVTFIARLEIGSSDQYQSRYKFQAWPGSNSGMSIGIGYDLRFANSVTL